MSKSIKLTVYLLKEGYDELGVLKEDDYQKISLDERGTLYTERSNVNPPSWVNNFFLNLLNDKVAFLKVASAKGLFLTKINAEGKEILFALSFGTGRHMLKSEAIEERFGLKVTLNSINPQSIRSIEKNTLGAISKNSREQLSKASKASDFGIDIEQDLVRTVTGKSLISPFGKTISGSDALNISSETNITNLKALLELCYQQYQSKEYLKNFDWIDQIQEVKNKKILEELNEVLTKKLMIKEFENIWMAVPEIIDWNDLAGFKYLPRQKEMHDDLYIDQFIDSFESIDIKKLKGRYVKGYSASNEAAEIYNWSAFKCMYAEIVIEKKQYILNNGKWYEVDNNFVRIVNNAYNTVRLSDVSLPNYNHENEGDYNEKIANGDDEFLLMDKVNVMHGGGTNKIEFCDLYTKKKQLIHIKRYGSSSVLSHLFMQGLNSAEYLFSDSDFRRKLNSKLVDGWKILKPQNRINATEYEIVFAIISNNDDERPRIPFFSKVGFKNVSKRLGIMGYNVSLKRIKSEK